MFVFTINELWFFHKMTMEHKMQKAENHFSTQSPYCYKHVCTLSLVKFITNTQKKTYSQGHGMSYTKFWNITSPQWFEVIR